MVKRESNHQPREIKDEIETTKVEKSDILQSSNMDNEMARQFQQLMDRVNFSSDGGGSDSNNKSSSDENRWRNIAKILSNYPNPSNTTNVGVNNFDIAHQLQMLQRNIRPKCYKAMHHDSFMARICFVNSFNKHTWYEKDAASDGNYLTAQQSTRPAIVNMERRHIFLPI